MKKIILLVTLIVTSIASHAQFSFGVQLGPNLGMGQQKTTEDDNSVNNVAVINDPKLGFLIGILAEVEFGKLAFRPELNFIQKGSRSGGGYVSGGYNYGGYYDETSEKFTLNYIEMPLNVVYNLKLRRAGTLFFGLGPTVAVGMSGKYKLTDYDDNGNLYTAKLKIKFDGDENAGDGDAHFKRIDIGANILAGFKFKMGVFGKIGFTYGFSNISPYDGYTYRNMGVSLCIGYMIGNN